MLKVVQQDLLTVLHGVICHQTNCLGAMGSGIALSIQHKWPGVFAAYQELCAKYPGSRSIMLLGTCQLIPASKDLLVANIFGQHNYGRFGIYTNYRAVTEAFQNLKSQIATLTDVASRPKVHIPFKMGCGLAGGDWSKYTGIVESVFPDAIVCKL